MKANPRARLFLSCAPEDAPLVEEFERHLPLLERAGFIVSRHAEPHPVLDAQGDSSALIEGADIILFFLSAAYLASIRAEREMRSALEERRKRALLIVPVLLRACLWQDSALAPFSILPRDGRPILSFEHRDIAWAEILDEILESAAPSGTVDEPALELRQRTTLPVYHVFKPSGTPTVTFVEPPRFAELRLSLAQPGRGLVVEGPSGIGKTTALKRAQELLERVTSPYANSGSRSKQIEILSARRPDHVRKIERLPDSPHGTVIVDDFHRLPATLRASLADHLKFLADYEDPDKKLVIAGIPRTGDRLMRLSYDLATRVDIFRFGPVDDDLILKMIRQGELALNIQFPRKNDIVAAARGSLNIAQMLCFHLCALESIVETQDYTHIITAPIELAAARVLDQVEPKFGPTARMFASLGDRRDLTTIEVLGLLSRAHEGFVSLEHVGSERPDLSDGVKRFVGEHRMRQLYECLPESRTHLLYDEEIPALIIDDPQFAFFLAQTPISKWMRLTGKSQSPKRNLVFISYSQHDSPWLERLRLHLKPLERDGLVKIWDDTRVMPGSNRRDDMSKAIDSAKVAVLLISAHYLASDFVIDHELPPLLAAASKDGALVCPLIVSPCRFTNLPSLARFQPFNSPNTPLTSIGYNEQEELLVKVTRAIEAALDDNGSVAPRGA